MTGRYGRTLIVQVGMQEGHDPVRCRLPRVKWGAQTVAGWFDSLAKRSARRASEPAEQASGLSRREVIGRGALVAGVAWTAPMLMATQAAAVGASVCPLDQQCQGTNNFECCAPDDICNVLDDGTAVCSAPGEGGGSCGNMGQGICDAPFKCNGNSNQCNNCADPNICGGEGAQCCSQEECFGDFVCTSQDAAAGGASFCRQECVSNGDCNTGQVCTNGLCAEPCTANSQCLGTAICFQGFCGFQVDGGVVCP